MKVKPAHLDRERAELYVDRYNDALAGAELDEAGPSVTKPPPRSRSWPNARLTLTPSGVTGTF